MSREHEDAGWCWDLHLSARCHNFQYVVQVSLMSYTTDTKFKVNSRPVSGVSFLLYMSVFQSKVSSNTLRPSSSQSLNTHNSYPCTVEVETLDEFSDRRDQTTLICTQLVCSAHTEFSRFSRYNQARIFLKTLKTFPCIRWSFDATFTCRGRRNPVYLWNEMIYLGTMLATTQNVGSVRC